MTMAFQAANGIAATMQIEQHLARDRIRMNDFLCGNTREIEGFGRAVFRERDLLHLSVEYRALLGNRLQSKLSQQRLKHFTKLWDVGIYIRHPSSHKAAVDYVGYRRHSRSRSNHVWMWSM